MLKYFENKDLQIAGFGLLSVQTAKVELIMMNLSLKIVCRLIKPEKYFSLQYRH